MKYNIEILDAAARRLASERIKLETASENVRRKIYSSLPRVAEIDAELSSTAFDIIRASFGKEKSAAEVIRERKAKNAELIAEREKLLTSSGYEADATVTKYMCDVCNDTGYTGGAVCTCLKSLYKKLLAEEINSSLTLPDVSFDDFSLEVYPEGRGGKLSPRAQMKEVLEFCKSFSEGFGESSESLYISGGSGLGKSFIAQCIAREVSGRGFSVVYETAFSALGLLEDIKFGRREDSSEIFYSADLLILDDVGAEMATPFTNAAFYNLINHRLSKGLSTVVISSLTGAEIKKRYGAQTESRLEGDFIKLEFLGDDIRLGR